MDTPSEERKIDQMLVFAAEIFRSKRLKRYAFASAEDLPADLREKLAAYKHLLLAFAGAGVLLLVHARLWTLGAVIVVWVALWPVKSRQEGELDSALGPYMESINKKCGLFDKGIEQ